MRASPPHDLSAIEKSAGTPTPVDESAAALERALQREVDSRREERFYWILGLVIVGDVAAFNVVQSWTGSVAIFLLEIILLLGLSKFLGVEHIIVPLERLLNKYLLPGQKPD
jgi:hypothetical protein